MDYHSDKTKREFHFLKQATRADLERLSQKLATDLSELPDQAFADPVNRKYAMHTQEATLVSLAYAQRHCLDQRVHRQLAKAAAFWGVEKQAQEIREDVEAFQVEEKFAVDHQADDLSIRHFPYHNSQTLKRAAREFHIARVKFPREIREKAAREILAAADRLSADIDQDVREFCEKAAGYGLVDLQALEEEVLLRKADIRKQAQHREKLATLAKISQLVADDAQGAKLAADALSAFDEETGLFSRYGRGTQLPEERVVGRTLSKMAGLTEGLVTLANGRTINISGIDWDKVAEFDPALAEEVEGDPKRAAQILPTWPRPDADNLISMLGLEPIDV